MENIKKENITKEDHQIYDFYSQKKIMTSGIEKCVCKIEVEIKIGDEYKYQTGSGFFCNIPSKNLKVFLTNNHILNQEFLDNSKKIKYSIEVDYIKHDYYLDLEKLRYKYTDDQLDFTVIEIIEEDNISHFLEIDEFINSKDYKDEQIFTIEYPLGKNLKISYGKI